MGEVTIIVCLDDQNVHMLFKMESTIYVFSISLYVFKYCLAYPKRPIEKYMTIFEDIQTIFIIWSLYRGHHDISNT